MKITKSTPILIFGGAGFIGTQLVRYLKKKDYTNITTTSRKSTKNTITKHITGIDITKPKTLIGPISSAKIVINLAGSVDFKRKNREKIFAINDVGARNILSACEKNKNIQRLIHISSSAAFGVGKKIITEKTQYNFTKNSRLVYSASKNAANKIIQKSFVPTNIIFPSLVLGAGQNDMMHHIQKSSQKRKIFPCPPGGNAIVDVRDLAQAIEIIFRRAPNKENYIVSNQTVSFQEFFREIFYHLKLKIRILPLPSWTQVIMTNCAKLVEKLAPQFMTYEQVYLGYQWRKYSTKKIQSLGYRPRYNWKQTIKESFDIQNI